MKMTVNNKFAILLAEKRVKERRNISLVEVAEATGISRKTLYAWENNTVTRFDVPVINALCEYFGIEPGALFQYVKDEKGISPNIHDGRNVLPKEKSGLYDEIIDQVVPRKELAKLQLPVKPRRKPAP